MEQKSFAPGDVVEVIKVYPDDVIMGVHRGSRGTVVSPGPIWCRVSFPLEQLNRRISASELSGWPMFVTDIQHVDSGRIPHEDD